MMRPLQLVLALLLGFMASSRVLAQDNVRGPGGFPNFDPAQFRQMMMDRLHEQLGATDEEWTVLQPKVEAVMAAQRDSRGGGMFFGPPGGGPGGPGGAFGQQPPTAVQQASLELRDVLQNKNATPEQIQQRLTALRDARAAARKKLEDAQKDLRELLTQRQEASLVTMGMLD